MTFRERKEKLDYLIELIEKGRCQSTSQMAKKFNCSSKTIERMIDELRNDGFHIKYCRKINQYKLVEEKT